MKQIINLHGIFWSALGYDNTKDVAQSDAVKQEPDAELHDLPQADLSCPENEHVATFPGSPMSLFNSRSASPYSGISVASPIAIDHKPADFTGNSISAMPALSEGVEDASRSNIEPLESNNVSSGYRDEEKERGSDGEGDGNSGLETVLSDSDNAEIPDNESSLTPLPEHQNIFYADSAHSIGSYETDNPNYHEPSAAAAAVDIFHDIPISDSENEDVSNTEDSISTSENKSSTNPIIKELEKDRDIAMQFIDTRIGIIEITIEAKTAACNRLSNISNALELNRRLINPDYNPSSIGNKILKKSYKVIEEKKREISSLENQILVLNELKGGYQSKFNEKIKLCRDNEDLGKKELKALVFEETKSPFLDNIKYSDQTLKLTMVVAAGLLTAASIPAVSLAIGGAAVTAIAGEAVTALHIISSLSGLGLLSSLPGAGVLSLVITSGLAAGREVVKGLSSAIAEPEKIWGYKQLDELKKSSPKAVTDLKIPDEEAEAAHRALSRLFENKMNLVKSVHDDIGKILLILNGGEVNSVRDAIEYFRECFQKYNSLEDKKQAHKDIAFLVYIAKAP